MVVLQVYSADFSVAGDVSVEVSSCNSFVGSAGSEEVVSSEVVVVADSLVSDPPVSVEP